MSYCFFCFQTSNFCFFDRIKGLFGIINKNENDNKKDNKVKREIGINQVYNLQNQQKIEKFNTNAINGLQNMGLTCYMNSVLQCLYHLKEFRDYVLKNNFDQKNQPKMYCLREVFIELNRADKNEAKLKEALKSFKQVISDNPLFNGKLKAADAKDLFLYLIEEIHYNELNTKKDIIIPADYKLKQTDLGAVINFSVSKFSQENESFISGNFYNFFLSRVLCTQCKQITYNSQHDKYIEIGVEKVISERGRCLLIRGFFILKIITQNLFSLWKCFCIYIKTL